MPRFLARPATRMMERWLPNPSILGIVPTLVAATAAITTQGTDPVALVEIWGSGFWELLSFACRCCWCR